MTLVLDSGGVTSLANSRARLQVLRDRDLWPPVVPAAVLTESLTGDHRRDVRTNRLLKLCIVTVVSEELARVAAALRFATGRAGAISAVDALVVAQALREADPTVVTADVSDIAALAAQADTPVGIIAA